MNKKVKFKLLIAVLIIVNLFFLFFEKNAVGYLDENSENRQNIIDFAPEFIQQLWYENIKEKPLVQNFLKSVPEINLPGFFSPEGLKPQELIDGLKAVMTLSIKLGLIVLVVTIEVIKGLVSIN